MIQQLNVFKKISEVAKQKYDDVSIKNNVHIIINYY